MQMPFFSHAEFRSTESRLITPHHGNQVFHDRWVFGVRLQHHLRKIKKKVVQHGAPLEGTVRPCLRNDLKDAA